MSLVRTKWRAVMLLEGFLGVAHLSLELGEGHQPKGGRLLVTGTQWWDRLYSIATGYR